MTNGRKRRAPLWARLSAWFDAVLVATSGGLLVTKEVVFARISVVEDADLIGEPVRDQTAGSEIEGPINVLLVGIGPRDDETPPLADSILVAHIGRN